MLCLGLAELNQSERGYLRSEVREKFVEERYEIVQDFVQHMPSR
jgi:hypothetical protein